MNSDYKGHGDQRYGHITYSHCGEDIVLLNIFELLGIKTPSYIDVGAHHPFTISNTALLYSRGSMGINIEANPNLISEIELHRPLDLNLNIGIGPVSGVMPFYMFDFRSGRNTFVKENAEPFFHDNHWFSITEVKDILVLTLDEVISTHSAGWPDLLCLDIEGLDTHVIATSLFDSTNGPKVICIEALNTADNTLLKQILERKGYFCYCRLSVDLIFVREEDRHKLY